MKRIVGAVIAVYAAYAVMDFLLHGVLLTSQYMATMDLWRPLGEMMLGLMQVTTLIHTIVFVLIYTYLIRPKSLKTGVLYGLLFGLGSGFSMGFGSYAMMPITQTIAWAWFLGFTIETTVCGFITGAIIKE